MRSDSIDLAHQIPASAGMEVGWIPAFDGMVGCMLNEYSFNFMDSEIRLWHDLTPYEKLR